MATRMPGLLKMLGRAPHNRPLEWRGGAGGRYHHLLDPHTARPGAGLLAASVVAARACDADACSTAILVSQDALAAILDKPPAGLSKILTIDADGSLRHVEPSV